MTLDEVEEIILSDSSTDLERKLALELMRFKGKYVAIYGGPIDPVTPQDIFRFHWPR